MNYDDKIQVANLIAVVVVVLLQLAPQSLKDCSDSTDFDVGGGGGDDDVTD
jgi:hypothetical protein